MKIKKIIVPASIMICLLLATSLISWKKKETLTFPFNQFVVNVRSNYTMWKYEPFLDIDERQSIIAPPKFDEDWNAWYKKMKSYQECLRQSVNDPSKMRFKFSYNMKTPLDIKFKRVLNDYVLKTNQVISIDGFIKGENVDGKVYLKLMYIPKGKEISRDVRKWETVDSISYSKEWTKLNFECSIPVFDHENLVVQPVLSFKGDSKKWKKALIKDMELSIPATSENKKIYEGQKRMLFPPTKGIDCKLIDRPELAWEKKNFVCNFALMWDSDLWDHENKVFTVDKYCEKMNREFGGMQSVLLWYTYPNLGIDDQVSWEMAYDIPNGGIEGLKKVVSDFHRNNVKVMIPYMCWDNDTKPSEFSDIHNLVELVSSIDADGVFYDTWKHVEDFRDELDKFKKGISLNVEHQPTIQNIQTRYAVTSSWGQMLGRYKNNGISRNRWLYSGHMQWTANRWTSNWQDDLAYTWINGQGLILWENIFGTLKFWNAENRSALRKINAIYQQFSEIYTSDTWKPYLPTEHPKIHASSWENDNYRIWNIITDKENIVNNMNLQIDDVKMKYYNLWTGEELKVKDGKVNVPIQRFSCVIGVKKSLSSEVVKLLKKQKIETARILPSEDNDPHMQQLCTKKARLPQKVNFLIEAKHGNLLNIPKGKYQLETSHVEREGGCFPDEDAKNNDDLDIRDKIIHHHVTVNLPSLGMMPRVVTNAEFGEFLKATNYRPKDKANFLKHWNGSKICPQDIKDEPVVFVSLDDARVYAKWAGMRLPTEWEWQVAGELHPDKFIFNEVWEWNESERNDGNNVFVTLRGGAEDWEITTSHWYFPGSTRDLLKNGSGGKQPLDSHSKYYLFKAGFDRAGTIGFRCVR